MLIGPVSELLNTVLKRVLPAEKMSEAERAHLEAELQLEMMKFDWQTVVGQLEINKEEAKHESVFVAGWRPAMGWVCVTSFAYNFVVQPFFNFIAYMFGVDLSLLPILDVAPIMAIVAGMLGLGGMRTFEKWSGTNQKR